MTRCKEQGNCCLAGSVVISKTMWTIKRKHRHIKAETLSEYLDGRLGGPTLARLDRQLTACGVCREELESHRTTVMLLKDLPIEAPDRSFTMSAPPPEPVRPRPLSPARVPRWVYAGAASVAAILLAVLVYGDTAGLLAPDEPTADGEAAAAFTAVRDEDVADSFQFSARGGQPPAPIAPAAMEAAAPSADDELGQPAEVAMASVEKAGGPEEALTAYSVEAGDLTSSIELSDEPYEPESLSKQLSAESQEQAASSGADARTPVGGSEAGGVPVATAKGTALFWRVLEGIAGALGLVFLAAFAFKGKLFRGAGRI